MAVTRGPDVSHYQGPIDWDAVGRTSYDFALARMTIGRGTRDDLGHRNLSEMVFRVPVAGAYGVVGTTEPVTDGAKFLLDEIATEVDPHKILVMLDAENFGDGSHPTIDQVDRYATTIHDRLGRWPVAYCPGWWMSQHGYTATGRGLANCPWAPSHYLPAPWDESELLANKPMLRYGFKSLAWLQYTDKASVAGISGGVDANVFYGTLDQLRQQLISQQEADMSAEDVTAINAHTDALIKDLRGDRNIDTSDLIRKVEITYNQVTSKAGAVLNALATLGATLQTEEDQTQAAIALLAATAGGDPAVIVDAIEALGPEVAKLVNDEFARRQAS